MTEKSGAALKPGESVRQGFADCDHSTGAWKTVTMLQHDQFAYPGGVNVDV
ncbi:hypothetical protein [Streptomyces atratus]|uniref:hypothetical protein n=1 Tax=Streptomyces atratus TaxID=1893 RepID=UPI0021A88EDE|nr:hypothetical protein [Streptomyces atratus]MCT2546975.1 hypothetical protein [Streptomyces atratus]